MKYPASFFVACCLVTPLHQVSSSLNVDFFSIHRANKTIVSSMASTVEPNIFCGMPQRVHFSFDIEPCQLPIKLCIEYN